VRRQQHQRAHPRRIGGGVDQGDGGAIAVAHQHGVGDRRGFQHAGEDVQRVAVHEVGTPRAGLRVRSPVAGAAVDERAAARRLRHARREIPPERDGAQALVQEDQRRRILARRGDPQVLQSPALHLEKAFLVGGAVARVRHRPVVVRGSIPIRPHPRASRIGARAGRGMMGITSPYAKAGAREEPPLRRRIMLGRSSTVDGHRSIIILPIHIHRPTSSSDCHHPMIVILRSAAVSPGR
jgi:hypothetical protein